MAWVLATSTTVNRFLSGTLVRHYYSDHEIISYRLLHYLYSYYIQLNQDLYLRCHRIGFLPVPQRINWLGRFNRAECLAYSFREYFISTSVSLPMISMA